MILYKVKCTRCPVDVGRQWFWEQEEAINAWNTRKPMEEVVEKLEENKWNPPTTSQELSANYAIEDAIEIIKESAIE